jgi:hypothetical protein
MLVAGLPKKEQGITNVHETEDLSLHRRSYRRLTRRRFQIKKAGIVSRPFVLFVFLKSVRSFT